MTKDRILLSDHFNYKRLLRFAVPSILMMIFISIYGMVDGLCISNFVGEKPFTAVNIVWPWGMLLGAFGFMFGSGGVALVGKVLGEGDRDKANRYFTFVSLATFIMGSILAILSDIFMERICIFHCKFTNSDKTCSRSWVISPFSLNLINQKRKSFI